MNVNIKLLPHQLKCLTSKKRIAGIVGGRGSGKSVLLAVLAVVEILNGGKVIIFGDNYKTLSLTLFHEIVEQFRKIGIEPYVNKSEMSIRFR